MLVMVLATLLTAATLAVVSATSTDVTLAAAFRQGLEAEYAAEAGVLRAILDLRALPDWTPVLNGTVLSTFADGAPTGVRLTDAAVFVDLDLIQSLATCGHVTPCSEGDRTEVMLARPWGPNNPRWRLFAFGPASALWGTASLPPTPMYVAVMVADDPAEADGNPEVDEMGTAPGAGVIRVRAEAFGSGGAHRVVEALIARAPMGARVRVLQWRRHG